MLELSPVRKDLIIFALLSVLIFAFWHQALFNFFAQDDFILINQFSQNVFWQDLVNSFGPPKVTHWRPSHNLYFLITGNLFGKNYWGYHLLTLLLQIGTAFLIYKLVKRITKSQQVGATAAFLYGIHPAHFISLFWISGGATIIGFFFLIASFYGYLLGKKMISLTLFALALLASEAMTVGIVIFWFSILLCRFETVQQRRVVSFGKFLIQITTITVVFVIMRFGFLTPAVVFNTYPMELSSKTLEAVKYYLLRIAGFSESSGDLAISIFLFGWLAVVAGLLVKRLLKRKNIYLMSSPFVIIIIGLFPFILIPTHLSPHYMNVSIWGFTTLIAFSTKRLKALSTVSLLTVFLIIAFYNINLTKNNNWVTLRSNLAKGYIAKIENANLPAGSTLVFADSQLSTADEAYIALGTGEAISFWFADKNYTTCFTAFEDCPEK